MAGSARKVVLDLSVKATEIEDQANDGSGLVGTTTMTHTWAKLAEYLTGTGSNQADLVYSDTLSLAASASTVDLAGSIASVLTGDTQTYVEITGFAILNKSTTSTENLTVGAGSNPWITWLNATGDAVVVGPGGVLVWTSPIDGAAVTAGTGDILTLDPGSDSFDVDLIIWGRSA